MTILTKEHQSRGLQKIGIRVWADDFNYLRRAFPDNYNAQLRRIIAEWVHEHRRKHDQ